MSALAAATGLLRTGPGRAVAFVAATVAVMFACVQISVATPYLGTIIATTAVYALAATGLDVVVGWLREISVGQAASMAVGAYCAAPLLTEHPLIALVAAAVGGGVTGVIVGLPAVRVRGFALATYTLVAGLGIQLLLSDVKAFGGTAGQAVLPGTVFGVELTDPVLLVVVSVGLAAAGVAVYHLLNHSLVGLSWRAMGQNSRMAGSLAVNPIRARLSAFGVAGVFAGVAGLLFALVSGYLAPDMFSFAVSIQLLAMVVIGGRVHPLGGTVGAILLALYTQYLPASTYSEALLGLILALSVWLAPRGAAVYFGDALRWLARRLIPSTLDLPGGRPAAPARPPDAVRPSAPLHPVTLAAEAVTKSYSGVVAVNHVDLSVRTGAITAIVGANGAGKTTLLDLFSGAVPATAGVVRLGDRDVTTSAAWRRARRGLLRCFQDAILFPDFTVRQALFVSGYRTNRYAVVPAILRLPHVRRRNRLMRARVEQVAAQFGLTEWLNTPLKNLSFGMVKIVQLAAVVLAAPQWILLDEPAAGLARAEVDRLAGLLRVLSEQLPDSGLLLVEHDALLVAGAADRVVVMAEGAIVEDMKSGADGWDDLLRSRHASTARILEAAPAGSDRTPATTAERVEATDLVISYGRFVAVRGASIDIRRGQLSVLVGTNGAGKSSMLNAIVGLKPPVSGTVTVDGQVLGRTSPHARARKGLVLVPSGRGLMGALTVAENLRVTRGVRGDAALDPLELFPELKPRLRQRAGTLSGGEQQMLALARSVQLNPRYLLVDELSLGLSVTVVERLIAALLAMRDSGVGLLIVEQNAPLALSYSDHAYVMNNCRVVFAGPSEEAAARPDLFRPVFLDPAHT